MPQDWNIGHLIKLPKKGNLKECKKLQRNRTIVSGCKGAEQNTSYKTIEGCR